MPDRHVPERTCIACRVQQAKRELVRIVRTVNNRAVVDPTGKASGRGAYLCRSASCWQAGLRKDALGRALKIDLSAEDREALETYAAGLDSRESAVAGHVAEGSIR